MDLHVSAWMGKVDNVCYLLARCKFGTQQFGTQPLALSLVHLSVGHLVWPPAVP
jgi:hypothetical protein